MILVAVLLPNSISFSQVDTLPFEGTFFQAQEHRVVSSDSIFNKIGRSGDRVSS